MTRSGRGGKGIDGFRGGQGPEVHWSRVSLGKRSSRVSGQCRAQGMIRTRWAIIDFYQRRAYSGSGPPWAGGQ